MLRAILITPTRVGGAYTARTSLLPTTRQLHASLVASKSVTEKVSDVADKVNKSVGQGLASAIETGEQVTEKTKETYGAAKDSAESTAKKTKEASGMESEEKKTKDSD